LREFLKRRKILQDFILANQRPTDAEEGIGGTVKTRLFLGPCLATTDEIPDPHTLRLWLKVNGETKQDGTTANLIFKISFLVSYVSQFMTLLPGDVISTAPPCRSRSRIQAAAIPQSR
jgi:2-keto-4-pentenoate hydratase/2-oxohepta-3-ene-1,7-dioic acid hydratase in catechol pathway